MKNIFILVVLSLFHFCAEANFELQVRIHSYIHLGSQRDYQGNHCDPIPDDPCENYFRFCLQRHGWSQTSTFCEYGSYDTMSHPTTSTSVTFSLGENGIAPNVDNPLIFSGSTGQAWIQRFQFQIRVDDRDFETPDLIDRVFVISNGLAISDTYTARQTYTGTYSNVRMDVSYRAICKQNYYGSVCTVFCRGRDDSTGHYECDSQGQPVCLQGWTNTENNCLTPVCSPSCPANSLCTAPEQCTCLAGWSGETCDQCIPATGCVHGNCSLPGECECEPGYSGTLCQIDDDVCGHQSPCQNGGTCNSTGPDSHTCACPAGFSGPNCEADVDECTTDPCLNGAICVNHLGNYSCVCSAGYTGQDCGSEIDECNSTPCQNGASCIDLLDDFNCTCPAGFTGSVCDVNINDCHPDLCLHGGTCVDQVNGYTCNCLPRYTGSQCEDEVPPPCSSSPCPSNTFCVEDIDTNMFTCEECQPGFESCDTVVIVDPDAQQGKNGTDVQPVNGMLIGGVIGGVVGALLLLCLIVTMVILCMRCCTCCPCVTLKHTDVDDYHAIGDSARQNPLYLGTSTLLSSQSGTLRSSSSSMPRYDGSSPHYAELSQVANGKDGVDFAPARQHSNPMYALAQTAIYSNGTPPALPAPRRGSVGRPVSPSHSPHYEHLPGDTYQSVAPQEVVASGKYDCLKPEAGPQVVTSGKYDSLVAPTASAKDNPYVIERGDGYKVLPSNPRPLDDSKPMTNETENLPLPPTNFNPYDSS